MRIGFIIAEYNPLHNGHLKHIQKTKQDLACDAIVCIMSGDITQRGEFAIKDKYTRAEWAIKAGADMVIELPVEYVLGSAQVFATGAKYVMDYFDCEKYLSFGSECGSTYVLEKIIEIQDSDECKSNLKEYLDKGNSYAKAMSLSFEKYLETHKIDSCISNILNEPNNILGLEYLRAIKGDTIIPYTIKREGSYLNSQDSDNPSAMQIRKSLFENKNVIDKVPLFVFHDLVKVQDNSEKLFSLIKYELSQKDNLDKIFGMNEGLHNRFLSFISKSSTYDEFMMNVKTKRFTMTSLSRALMCALINNTYTFNDVMNNDLEYLNVLAVKSSQKKLMGLIELPLITRPSELEKLEKDKNVNSSLDKKSANLYKAINYNYDAYTRFVD